MTIDVEGADMDVLETNDWQKYRPKMILIEIFNSTFDDLTDNPVSQFLYKNGYQIYSKCVQTVFFISNEYMSERTSIMKY
jgi:hypothetical protein